jgi:hypothetical protein
MKWTKWYDVTECDNTVDDPLVTDTDELHGINEDDLSDGRIITNWDPKSWIQATKAEWDGVPDDALQSHLWPPIYSYRLRNAIEAASIKGIQWLPINVLHRDGSSAGLFFVANILNMRPALDEERSDLTRYEEDYFIETRRGKVSGIWKPVLKKSELAQVDIIRLQQFTVAIFVSQKFKELFEQGRFTGWSFTEVETV